MGISDQEHLPVGCTSEGLARLVVEYRPAIRGTFRCGGISDDSPLAHPSDCRTHQIAGICYDCHKFQNRQSRGLVISLSMFCSHIF